MISFYENRQDTVFGFHCGRLNYPPHVQSSLEFIYAASGRVTVIINGDRHSLQAGELAVIFPNCTHHYETPANLAVNWDLVAEDIRMVGVQTTLAGEYAEQLTRFRPERPFLPAELVPPEIPLSLDRLLQQDETRNPSVPLCRAYTQLILALVWPYLELKPVVENNVDGLIYQVSDYILQHYQNSFSLEDMAMEMGLGKYRLSRIFSDQLHMNFNDYLNNVRVSMAQNLLSTTDLPITSIIYECGFESQATFNRSFRKISGVSPREYRRYHRAEG